MIPFGINGFSFHYKKVPKSAECSETFMKIWFLVFNNSDSLKSPLLCLGSFFSPKLSGIMVMSKIDATKKTMEMIEASAHTQCPKPWYPCQDPWQVPC